MGERARMFKMLSCLVMAMTVCAALLSWMAPRDPTTAVLTDPEFSRVQAREALGIDERAAPIPWEQIEIVADGIGVRLL